MRNPYAAPDPRDSGTHWWLLVVVVALATLVVVVSLGKDRSAGGHLGYAASILESGRAPFPR